MAKYLLSLNLSGEVYKSEGDTILEALEQLKPKQIKTWGTFNLKVGNKKAELYMRPFLIKRILFGGKFNKDFFEKKILMSLK